MAIPGELTVPRSMDQDEYIPGGRTQIQIVLVHVVDQVTFWSKCGHVVTIGTENIFFKKPAESFQAAHVMR